MKSNPNKESSNNYIPNRKGSNNAFALIPFGVTFCIMAIFWILFSGRFDFFHLFLGVISCLIVSGISYRLFFPKGLTPDLFKSWIKFAGYLPWLFKEIFLANLHLLYLTFHPNMMGLINPKVVEFKSKLKSDVSRTTLANSITLTPGTITIYSGVMGKFVVHCIDEKSGAELPGEMENKISKVFNE